MLRSKLVACPWKQREKCSCHMWNRIVQVRRYLKEIVFRREFRAQLRAHGYDEEAINIILEHKKLKTIGEKLKESKTES